METIELYFACAAWIFIDKVVIMGLYFVVVELIQFLCDFVAGFELGVGVVVKEIIDMFGETG